MLESKGPGGVQLASKSHKSWRQSLLATKRLPDQFKRWNQKYGAPEGKDRMFYSFLKRAFPRLERNLPTGIRAMMLGPFGFQRNNTTREFEYPWALHATALEPGMNVLEVGGGYSGLQFVLSMHGCNVTNVDPSHGQNWLYTQDRFDSLNKWLGTNVKFVASTIQDAALPTNSFDRIFSISVLEHLEDDQRHQAVRTCHQLLKPGGMLIVTADLFLNIEPFTRRVSNSYGTNADLNALFRNSSWELLAGEQSELMGYPDFSPEGILANLESYLVGRYPALAQCLVLRKVSA